MKTLANNEAHILTIEEYNGAFKNEQVPFINRIAFNINTFFAETIFLMKFLYFVILVIMILGVLFEIKCIYHIDFFRGIDTPFDTYFNAAKNNVTGELR
ncbi:MAG: hypothetical protein K9G64_06790 [Bacteroidia bacterium]|nr:hypothetical protein [Bacteroidia bacterium]